ncbi:hypothetical protein ORI89_18840, partial [Sphingobacterium sp. UT-1RO-CII-1]|uniref:hypothetical protein n=1 Tax=Sphingobacterium sp. UT-1RO-CII-1 TaxID=2995225 RepID=UPI00227B0899
MIKYRIPYKSFDDSEWLVTIDLPAYNGNPIDVRGVEGSACNLRYEGGTDDPFDNPVVNTIADINIYNEGQINVEELQLSKDRSIVVAVTRNEQIKFKGYLITDNIQREFAAPPYTVRLSATTGLNLLEDITYKHKDLAGGRTPLNYFRQILQSTDNLGINLPIRWVTTVEGARSPINGDPLTKLNWGIDDDAFSYFDVEKEIYIYNNCNFIIEGITQALQARIVQIDGAWWILDLRKSLGDTLSYLECANTTGTPVITTGTRNNKRIVGTDYTFKNEDAVVTTKPALSKVNVRYKQTQNQNILPNGDMDDWDEYLGPEYWGLASPGFTINKYPHINDRGGASALLSNTSDVEKTFGLNIPIPLDGNVLFNKIRWGFTFMAKDGFPQNEFGAINFKKSQLKTSVKYTINKDGQPKEYYLNEFGYWSDKNLQPNQSGRGEYIDAYKWFSINFDPDKSWMIGDAVYIKFFRNGEYEEYLTVFTEVMDAATGTNYIDYDIPNTNRPAPATITVNNARYGELQEVRVYKVEDYYKYIYFNVENLRVNDATAITFTGPGNLDVKLIDPGAINEDTPVGVGLLSIYFYPQAGQKYVLDDIWFEVNDNNDLYTAVLDDSNANTQDIDLHISSSFSGVFLSNFMRGYYNSDRDWLFTDGTHKGSLTELYARMVMGFRNKASRVFNGTISTRGKDWSYLDNYEIIQLIGERFLNINPVYNTERNEVNLIAMGLKYDILPQLKIGHNIANLPALINRIVTGNGSEGGGADYGDFQDLQSVTEIGNETSLEIITKGTHNTNILGVPKTLPSAESMQADLAYIHEDGGYIKDRGVKIKSGHADTADLATHSLTANHANTSDLAKRALRADLADNSILWNGLAQPNY